MKIIWCMFLEIWSMTDIIFSHFGPFFALLPPNNPENPYFERWKKCQEISLFHTSIPYIDPKNKNLEQFLKTWRYYPITYVYHKWRYLMYDSWDMKHDRQNFCPFTLHQSKKWTFQKKNEKKRKEKKRSLKIPSLYTSVPKIIIICYTVSEI